MPHQRECGCTRGEECNECRVLDDNGCLIHRNTEALQTGETHAANPQGATLAGPHGSEPVNAHALTLQFHRFLSEDEWRNVAELAWKLPHVKDLRADAVIETPDTQARPCNRIVLPVGIRRENASGLEYICAMCGHEQPEEP